MMASFDKALDVARERMGFAELFPKQWEAVEAFVSGRDVFISLPTGYGKSFCYGCLPIVFNCLRDKTSSIVVVVTLLVAIMKEQAIDFERKGLSAMYITCGSVGGEGKMQDVLDGLYDLVFISPEQLLMKWCWREMLHSEPYLNMVAFVVDEAHCVKKW